MGSLPLRLEAVKTIYVKIPNWILSDTLILFVTGSEAFNR